MIKFLPINTIKGYHFTEEQFNKLPLLTLSSNIKCSQNIKSKYYAIFNHNNISTLNNYAQKENLQIYFRELENDIFHNSVMTVFKKDSSPSNHYQAPMKLNIDSKENFVKSLREIYNNAQEAVKNFATQKLKNK